MSSANLQKIYFFKLKKSALLGIAATSCTLIFGSPATAFESLWGIQTLDDGEYGLVNVSPEDGNISEPLYIFDNTLNRVNGLTFDPSDQLFYGTFGSGDDEIVEQGGLFTIDLQGEYNYLGLGGLDSAAIPQIDIDPISGNLYAWTEDRIDGTVCNRDCLVVRDKATGSYALVGVDPDISTYAYSLSFSKTGDLYLINGDGEDGDQIYLIDKNTGEAVSTGVVIGGGTYEERQPKGDIGPDGYLYSAAVSPDGEGGDGAGGSVINIIDLETGEIVDTIDVGNTTINQLTWATLSLAVSELASDVGYGYATSLSQSLEYLNNNARQVRSLIGKGEDLGWQIYESKDSSVSILATSKVLGGTLNGSFYKVGSVHNTLGVEYKINDSWSVGAAYGYGTNWMDGENDFDDSSNISSTINTGSIFGQYKNSQGFKLQSLFSYSSIENDSTRYFDGEKNTANYDSAGYSFSIAAMKDFFLKTTSNDQNSNIAIKATPLVGLTGNFYNQDGFTEDDDIISVDAKNTSSIIGEVGVELAALMPIGTDTYMSPKLNASYEHNFISGGSNSEISLSDATTSVTTDGIQYGSSRGRFGGGIDFLIKDQFVISLNGAYTTFGSGDTYSYGGMVTYKF